MASDISQDELQLAARNHALPLEALREDVTPAGLHYLLIHFDIPAVDAATWRLEVGGSVERPFALTLGDLSAVPSGRSRSRSSAPGTAWRCSTRAR